MMKKLLAFGLALVLALSIIPSTAFAASPTISYYSHVEGIGDMSVVSDGTLSGTQGESRRLEILHVKLDGVEGGIELQGHVQDYGWMSVNSASAGEWTSCGVGGESRRLEAFIARLTGVAAQLYTLQYRVHVQDYGTLGWCSDGEISGTVGEGRRIESVELRLVPKNGDPDKVYMQTDKKWEKVSYSKGYTMKESACGVFALVNALHYMNGTDFSDDDIKEIAQYAIDKGYRKPGQGTSKELAVGLAKDYGSDYHFKTGTTYYYQKDNTSVINGINSCLDAGGAIYFSVKSSSGGHIVCITNRRLNSKGQVEYLLLDSYASDNRVGGGYGWCTMDKELDLHYNGKTIVTKGSLGFYTLYPTD